MALLLGRESPWVQPVLGGCCMGRRPEGTAWQSTLSQGHTHAEIPESDSTSDQVRHPSKKASGYVKTRSSSVQAYKNEEKEMVCVLLLAWVVSTFFTVKV